MIFAFSCSSILAVVTRGSTILRKVSVQRTNQISMMSSKSRIPQLLPASQAIELHSSSSVKFIDGSWHMGNVRNPYAEYLAERIPGSQYFNIDEVSDKSNDLPHMLPDEKFFDAKVSSMGISNDDHIVVYVHPNCFSGPRVWWMFKAFGHENVSLLDGGLSAWKAAGGETICTAPSSVVANGNFKSTLSSAHYVNVDDVLKTVNTGSSQIVDARSKARFEGSAPEPRAGLEGGHMPGALNLPFTTLLKEDLTTFKSPVEIRDAFKEAGVIFGAKIILTCGSGVSASVLAMGLTLMGQELQSCPIYDGSWSEWGGRSDLPKTK